MSLVADVDIREMVTSLFQPDVLLPAQYFERMKRTDVRPEKALMLAVLEDAVCCFQKYCLVRDKRGKILFKEAESWIFDDDNNGIFSYRNVCDFLGIDADYLRCGLLRWKEKHLSPRLNGKVYKLKKKHRIQAI
jgi:hypothetical protein